MKAIRFHAYGGPEVLEYEDAPRPDAGPGQVLVRVHATALNPIDWKIRAGYLKDMMPVAMPFIPGSDVAGIVEAVGPGAGEFSVGEAVFGRSAPNVGGGYAEYVAVPMDALAAKPNALSFPEAASVPVIAMTAWQGIFDFGGLTAGQTLLVHGGAGGVGSFAVQFARWKGARVFATASAADLDYVKSLGAEQAIDYKAERFEERVSGVDVVLDTQGGETQERSWKTLKPGGILVTTLPPAPTDRAAALGMRAAAVQVTASRALLAEIAALLESGQVKTRVGTTMPLSAGRQAQELGESGRGGKIVLIVV